MLSVPAASSLGSCVVLSITTVANGTFGLRVWLCVCVCVCVCGWVCGTVELLFAGCGVVVDTDACPHVPGRWR